MAGTVLTAQHRMCVSVGGALSETVAMVSLRTKRMLSVLQLRNKKMFRDRTEPMLFRAGTVLFRAGTVPETVPVRSLFIIYKMLGEITIRTKK